MGTDNHIQREEVTRLFKAKVAELGGVDAAAARWGVSGQMIYMIQNEQRRPNAAMLKDIRVRLIQVPASEHYEPIPDGEAE